MNVEVDLDLGEYSSKIKQCSDQSNPKDMARHSAMLIALLTLAPCGDILWSSLRDAMLKVVEERPELESAADSLPRQIRLMLAHVRQLASDDKTVE